MDTGAGKTAHHAAINVTPLIDVLLVLLFIFMVIQPAIQHGLETIAPTPNTQAAPYSEGPIVLGVKRVSDGASYTMDGQSVAGARLSGTLRAL